MIQFKGDKIQSNAFTIKYPSQKFFEYLCLINCDLCAFLKYCNCRKGQRKHCDVFFFKLQYVRYLEAAIGTVMCYCVR